MPQPTSLRDILTHISKILHKQQLREMISKLPDDEIKSQVFTPIRLSFSALESEELDDSSDTSLPFTPPSTRSEYLKLNNQLSSLEPIITPSKEAGSSEPPTPY